MSLLSPPWVFIAREEKRRAAAYPKPLRTAPKGGRLPLLTGPAEATLEDQRRALQIDEACTDGTPVREWLLITPGLLEWSYEVGAGRAIRTLAALLAYADVVRTTRKRTPMDVAAMVRTWTDNIARLTTSHEKQERDDADRESDELLTPLLAAPVRQIREFATALAVSLREDTRIPWMVWRVYQQVLEEMIAKADDGHIIELKSGLAHEIAVRAEQGIERGDLVAAIAGALQWRSAESLTKVNEALKTGTATPRLTGRQSCLFLEVGDAMVML